MPMDIDFDLFHCREIHLRAGAVLDPIIYLGAQRTISGSSQSSFGVLLVNLFEPTAMKHGQYQMAFGIMAKSLPPCWQQ